MTTSYPDPARPTPVQTCTVMDFALCLGLSRRGALDLFNAAATHLDVVVRSADSGRLTVTLPDFVRMIELVQTLNSVGLTIRQLQRIQQSQDPNLWTLLQGRRVPKVAAPEAVDQPEVRVTDAAVERIEAMLVDHLAQQRLMLDQHLSRPAPVHHIPAPVPTPAPARPRQGAPAPVLDVHTELPPQPLPAPVPARAPNRGLTDWPKNTPMPVPTPVRAAASRVLEDWPTEDKFRSQDEPS